MPCHVQGCIYTDQVTKSSFKNHMQKYHSNSHKILFAATGLTVTVTRSQQSGKLECVCKNPEHERYNLDRIRRMAQCVPHPPLDTVQFDDIPLSNPLSLRPPSISNQATPYLDSFSHQEHGASSSITLASGENHTPLQQRSDIDMFNAPVTSNTNSLCQLPPASALESDLHTDEEFKMDIDEEAEEEAVDLEAEMIEVSEPESDELPEEIENLEDCAHTVDTPTFLSRINIAVESVYRLCICISCAIPIPYQSIWTHQYQQHYRGLKLAPESRLPPRNIVLAKLQELGAHEPKGFSYCLSPSALCLDALGSFLVAPNN
ncbi:hypothetical protein EV361DRAFT_966698 [Lentinula raphanica]|nr:hypothetical protein EV361DRAFT_966698 [Lentinula raphanica]